MGDAGADKPREPSRLVETVRKVGRGVEDAIEAVGGRVQSGVGTVKQGVERVSERVSKPRLVQLTGTSGHDLLLDVDGRRSGTSSILFFCIHIHVR